MTIEPPIDDEELLAEFLLDWEDSQSTKSPKTPEEICQQRPDLCEPLKQRIAALSMVNRLCITTIRDVRGRVGNPAASSSLHAIPQIPGYEILQEIGRGGMGIVYKAKQQKVGRFVAIKIIKSGAWGNRSLAERIRHEAKALGMLNHEHVIKVFDVVESNAGVCLILEYVDGGNLAQRDIGFVMNTRTAAEIAHTVAMTMCEIHRKGFLHRDLKPANLLWDSAGIVKISDFGLAKELAGDSSSTMTGGVFGSPSYMAPEQAMENNAEIGVWTDVYAIGATLYNFLTGPRPLLVPLHSPHLHSSRKTIPFHLGYSLLKSHVTWKRSVSNVWRKCLQSGMRTPHCLLRISKTFSRADRSPPGRWDCSAVS